MKRLSGLIICCVAIVAIVGVLPYGERGVESADGQTPAERPPSLVLISFDTMRADFLGVYGSETTRTPRLDTFAQEGVLFQNAYASCPLTHPSMWSVLHSVRVHDFTYDSNLRTSSDAIPIAERLREAGFYTAGFTGNSILNPGSGFERGFDHFSGTWHENSFNNESTLSQVSAFLQHTLQDQAQQQPYFLFVHFFDPHTPWGDAPTQFKTYPPEASSWAEKAYRHKIVRREHSFNTLLWETGMLGYTGGQDLHKELQDDTYERLFVPSYRSEISWSDDVFGRLLNELTRLGLLENAVVAVTADHGYAFWEHSEDRGYRFSLFNEAVRVPLMIRAPDAKAGKRIPAAVSLIDLGATLIDYAGLGVIHEEGRSLRPLMTESEHDAEPRFAYAESVAVRQEDLHRFPTDTLSRHAVGVENIHTMLARDRYKILFMPSRQGAQFELYDIIADPGEQIDLYDPTNAEHTALRHTALALRSSFDGDQTGPQDAAMYERLQSLGYIRGPKNPVVTESRVEQKADTPAEGERDIEEPLATVGLIYQNEIAHWEGRQLTVQGTAEDRYTYLVQWPPVQVHPPASLKAAGRLQGGGLTIGVLKDGQWYDQHHVTQAGAFEVTLQVTEPGEYTVVVANNLPEDSLHNDFEISAIGWWSRKKETK